MKKHTDLSRVLVVDIECTCWETREEQGDRPSEIIEIGICVLDRAKGVHSISSYLVKPRYTDISPFCTQLTGWKPEDVADAADIRATMLAIRADYQLSAENIWFSYGEYDRIKLTSQQGVRGGVGELYGIERHANPFDQMRHFNVKTLMALKEGLNEELGMDRALQYYGETLEGRHHNGADDAANIAKIVRRVLS